MSRSSAGVLSRGLLRYSPILAVCAPLFALSVSAGSDEPSAGMTSDDSTAAAPFTKIATDDAAEVTTGLLGDLGWYSDYTERGLSYSRDRYSLQGHVEYDAPQGFYVGTYVVDQSEIVNKVTAEIDPYAGYVVRKGDWSIDTGLFTWFYPHSRLDISGNRYNTVEATVDVTYKIFGVKIWYDLRDYWGLDQASAAVNYHLTPDGSSQGSGYIDSHLNIPLPRKFVLKLHVGHQYIRSYGELNYTDWLVGVEKTIGAHITLGAAYTDTNANESLFADPHGLKLGKAKPLAYFRWGFP